jgi:hypothetical protein
MKLIDLTNKRFGRLVVIKRAENDKKGNAMWLCKCDCGEIKPINGSRLRMGKTNSCGCLSQEVSKTIHITHNKSGSKVHNTWLRIKSRCYCSNNIEYSIYGGRGIKVCDRWLESFENFYKDMGEPPTSKHSIDRIDVNGNYEPSNCKWSTMVEQCNNRRTNHYLVFNNEKLTITQWARKLGLPRKTLDNRIKLGWSVEKALTTPRNSKNNLRV